MMFKLGACLTDRNLESAPLLYAGPFSAGLELLQQAGFNGAELSVRDSRRIDQDDILKTSECLGIEIFAIATGQSYVIDKYFLYCEKEEIREKAIDRLRGHIDFAARIGCFVIIGGIRGMMPFAATNNPESIKAGHQSLKRVDAYAQQRGVQLLLEPINRYETNVVNTIADGISLIREIESRNIGLLSDTFHMNIEETSHVKALRLAADHLRYIHFADSNRLAPGWGHINFFEIISSLHEIQYDGAISMEILPRPDNVAALGQAVSYFREVEAKTHA